MKNQENPENLAKNIYLGLRYDRVILTGDVRGALCALAHSIF